MYALILSPFRDLQLPKMGSLFLNCFRNYMIETLRKVSEPPVGDSSKDVYIIPYFWHTCPINTGKPKKNGLFERFLRIGGLRSSVPIPLLFKYG